ARAARNLHRPVHSRSARQPQSHERSQRARSPAWYVPFDIRPEHLHASTAIGHLSNSQEEKDATPPSPALRHGRASVILGSGSWHSCQAPKHIAKRHRPNACPSSAPRCRRLPSLHRCRRRACPLERAVRSLTAPHSRHQQPQNGAIDHSRQVQATPRSAEHSCDRRVQSTRSRKAGTCAAAPCALSGLETASTTAQARLPNPIVCSSWSALQKPTTHESQKK